MDKEYKNFEEELENNCGKNAKGCFKYPSALNQMTISGLISRKSKN